MLVSGAKNLKIVGDLLKPKDYPKHFVDEYINKKFAFLNNKNNNPVDIINVQPFGYENIVVLTFIKQLQSFYRNIYGLFDVKIVFRYDKDTYHCFSENKDPVCFDEKTHVITYLANAVVLISANQQIH